MKDHLKEGDRHGEEHPDVDHLDVRSDRKALGKAQEAEKTIFCKYIEFKKLFLVISKFRHWLLVHSAGHPFCLNV